MKRLLLTLVCCAAVNGCEQTVPSDGLLYVDHIVIHGMMIAGESISISVAHTLPLNTVYTPEKADIPDAVATITVDGRTIPLAHTWIGLFRDTLNNIVESGKIYRIDVWWHGLHAYASTRIPEPPVILSSELVEPKIDTFFTNPVGSEIDFSGSVDVLIKPDQSHVYAPVSDSVFADTTGNGHDEVLFETSYKDFLSIDDTILSGNIEIRERFGSNESTLPKSYRIVTVVGSFDIAYYDFLRSYDQGERTGPFSSGGRTTEWNIKGDGIGLFIGQARASAENTYTP